MEYLVIVMVQILTTELLVLFFLTQLQKQPRVVREVIHTNSHSGIQYEVETFRGNLNMWGLVAQDKGKRGFVSTGVVPFRDGTAIMQFARIAG